MSKDKEEAELLAEELDRVRTHNERLACDYRALESKLDRWTKLSSIGELFVTGTICIVVASVLLMITYFSYLWVATPDIPSHCVVKQSPDSKRCGCKCSCYRLNAIVPWGPDSFIGSYTSLDEAMAEAEKIGCELK